MSLYDRHRGEEWKEQIDRIKNAIMAVKKELAFHQQIPTVYAIFDQVNNGDYRNVSEFKLVPERQESEITPKESALDIAARHINGNVQRPELPDVLSDDE